MCAKIIYLFLNQLYTINCMNLRWRGSKPVRKPVLERSTIGNVPSDRLSYNPVQAKPELSYEHANPSPSSCLSWFWDVCYSIHPYQTYTHQYCWRKYSIYTPKPCTCALKQRKTTLFSFSTTLLLAHLSVSSLSLVGWRELVHLFIHICIIYIFKVK